MRFQVVQFTMSHCSRRNGETVFWRVLLPLLTITVVDALTEAEYNTTSSQTVAVYHTESTFAPANYRRDGRIIGGHDASIFQFPHQVSLQLDGRHICGAAVLNAYLVLGAAHCAVLASMPELYSVRAGSAAHAVGGVVVPVRRIATHARYQQPSVMNNDIAVYALAYALPFSAYIQLIPLATSADMNDTAMVLYVSGWGSVSQESRDRSPTLRYTTLQRVDQQRCAAVYAQAMPITAGMMCAASADGSGHDSCRGDSGGPLVAYLRGRPRLVGIVSFGAGCGHEQFPGIYTRVDAYREWIERVVKLI